MAALIANPDSVADPVADPPDIAALIANLDSVANFTDDENLEKATLPAAPPFRQILSALQLKYSSHGYVNNVIIGLNMELDRVVAFRSYRSSSHSTTMIAELPLKWHGMWQVCKKGTIGIDFHYNADMNKARHHRFMPVCDGIMKFTDLFNKSDLLVEVSVFVGKHTFGVTSGKDEKIVTEIIDSAEIFVEIVAESDEEIVAEIVGSAEIVVEIDEEIVAALVDSAEFEWIFAGTDL
jgi:hypothetical protein